MERVGWGHFTILTELGLWQVSMDSEEMIGFLLKPAKLYDGRAGNDLRKFIWSDIIVLHRKGLGLRKVKWLLRLKDFIS